MFHISPTKGYYGGMEEVDRCEVCTYEYEKDDGDEETGAGEEHGTLACFGSPFDIDGGVIYRRG